MPPTPPVAFEGEEGGVPRLRALAPQHQPEPGFLAALAAVVAVDVDVAHRAEAGRDWWPLAVGWALAGEVPAFPAVIARPTGAAEVAAVLRLCTQHGVPVTPAGGRSGVCGASLPVHGGVVLDTTALAGLAGVDDTSLTVEVLPGTFGDVLESELRTGHGVTLGHWPQSMALSTVGGWLACRSAGQYSTRYGKIEDMVVGLEVVLADGSVLRTGGAPRAAVGPDLSQLFVGAEGTLGVITRAWLRCHPAPAAERRGAWSFATLADGLDACRRILRRGATPAVLRAYDGIETRRTYDVDGAALLVLDEGDPGLVDAVFQVVDQECAGADRLDDTVVGQWLEHRNDVSALESLSRKGLVVDTMEVSGPWSVLPGIYDGVLAALAGVEHTLVASAHASHSYPDGACLYFSFAGSPPASDRERYYVAAWDAATAATLGAGAALSHHHGVGLNRSRFMAEALGGGLDVLRAVKAALDPGGILNPGKLGLPSPFGPVDWPPG